MSQQTIFHSPECRPIPLGDRKIFIPHTKQVFPSPENETRESKPVSRIILS